MIPADCPVSEGLAPLPYLALLRVGGVSGVISGAVSGTASPECAIGGMRSLCRHLGQPANPIFSLFLFPSLNSLLAATKPGLKSRWLIPCLSC